MPDPLPSYVLSLDEATQRLGDIDTVAAGGAEVRMALPATYAKQPKERYRLILLVGADGMVGSAIEISRLMAETGELRPAVLAAVPTPLAEAVIGALRARYRLTDPAPLVFAPGGSLPGGASLVVLAAGADPLTLVPSFVRGIRAHLSTGKAYGRGVTVLTSPLVRPVLPALRPLFGRAQRRRAVPAPAGDPRRY